MAAIAYNYGYWDTFTASRPDRIANGDEALGDGPRRKTNRQAPGQLVS